MAAESKYHIPVLLDEVIANLNIIPSGKYVDCTFGGGGHSKAILERLGPDGRLFVFDQDKDAARNIPENESRITFIPHNFIHLQRFLKFHDVDKVDGILADIGVSSHQINEPARGFSTRYDAALDMRMDQSQPKTAAQILNTYSEKDLHLLFEQYGEVTNAKTLAALIVEERKTNAFTTTNDFKNRMYEVVKGNPEKYFAQVFQALRIEVNDELGALKSLLEQSVDVLANGGRLAIITFHSLEDRIVKTFLKNETFEEMVTDIFGQRPEKKLKVITKKPILPSKEELIRNPRSRSSKLRVAEKIELNL